MPELPEVETVKRSLQSVLDGKIVERIERRDVSPAKKPDGQFYGSNSDIEQFLIGATISNFRRRAKVLIIDMSTDYTLIIHLKMSGQLVAIEPDGKRIGGGHPTKSLVQKLPDSTTRTIFYFEGGQRLFYNDQRKFGWIKLIPTARVEDDPLIKKLGPEPFYDNFTTSYLAERLARRTIAIKSALLDQSMIGGIGNIYADEALNMAGVDPRRESKSLTEDEVSELVKALQDVMRRSIELGGTSFSDYVDGLGEFGKYFEEARVYGRTGEPCPKCGSPVQKIMLGGRGTHFCEICQS